MENTHLKTEYSKRSWGADLTGLGNLSGLSQKAAILLKTVTQANYRILDLVEYLVAGAPKGTALGLSDLIRAMYSQKPLGKN